LARIDDATPASHQRTVVMETLDALDHIAINDVLCRFFLAFDERDWAAMEYCLAPEVFIDYASSGREQPITMSGAEFVQRRRNAVDTLAEHHSFSNLLLTRDGDGVKGRCNYLEGRAAACHTADERGLTACRCSACSSSLRL
jgi:SnoaL-like domain